jgi:hypothetical protein
VNAASLRRPRGQDLSEFALTILLLAFMSFGILDLGRVVYYYSALQNAVREGARYAIVDASRTSLVDGIVRDRALGLDPDELNPFNPADFDPDPVPLCDLDGVYDGVYVDNTDKTLTVCYQYGFSPVTPIIGKFLGMGQGDVIMILASSTMHHEY